MTTTAGRDFEEFVAARWSELEAAARVVVLDPDLARSSTLIALTRLGRRWAEVLDEGRPHESARAAVLTGAVTAATAGPRRDPGPVTAQAHEPATDPEAPDDEPTDDPVVAALLAAVRGAAPLERAVLEGATLWHTGTDEVAHLLRMPSATVAGHADTLRDRLERAHASACAETGLSPWARDRDRDVQDAVEALLRGLTDPPDPAALVSQRARGVHRRTLVVGGAAVVALGGAGVAVARRPPSPTRTAPTAPPTVAGPDDPRWATTQTWPARGPLAEDAGVTALVRRRASPGDHVLWAGDLGTRRLVLVWARPEDGPTDSPGTLVRVFSGAAGSDPTALLEVPFPWGSTTGTSDIVGLAVPDGPTGPDGFDEEIASSLLLVLTRPTTASAEVSLVVTPTRAGGVERDWAPLPLEAGVSATTLDGRVPTGLSLRVGEWQGPPVSTALPFDRISSVQLRETVDGARLTEAAISAVTGIPSGRLTTTVLVDEEVPPGVVSFDASTTIDAAAGRLLSLLTTTPDGAVLRTTTFEGGGQVVTFETAVVLPADRRTDPLIVQVADLRPDVARFVLVAPGADRVQMISTTPDGYPISKRLRTGGRDVTVVPIVNGTLGAAFRVVLRDRRGRVVFDDVPAIGRSLLDG